MANIFDIIEYAQELGLYNICKYDDICSNDATPSNNQSWIYVLCEPDGETVRYVGKFKKHKLSWRFNQHISELNGSKYVHSKYSRKNIWIKSLIDKGFMPIIKPICLVDTTESSDFEIKFIEFCRNNEFNLVNGNRGGGLSNIKFHNRKPHSDETKSKIGFANSLALKNKRKSKSHREIMNAIGFRTGQASIVAARTNRSAKYIPIRMCLKCKSAFLPVFNRNYYCSGKCQRNRPKNMVNKPIELKNISDIQRKRRL